MQVLLLIRSRKYDSLFFYCTMHCILFFSCDLNYYPRQLLKSTTPDWRYYTIRYCVISLIYF